jgi:branched-chain amino acid transport system ATP-binding protein
LAKRDSLLELSGVRAGYGDAVVLDDVSLEVPRNGSLAVLGRNGVGKSTLLLTMMGYTRLHHGTLSFAGEDITALRPHQRAQLGIGWVAQEREVFPSLSLEENLTVAARPGRWTAERVYELFPRLKERRAAMGNQLSGGEQQMLAIGRALMTNPQLMILDEATEGLAPLIRAEIWRVVAKLKAEGLSIMLIDKNVHALTKVADRHFVIERGRVVWTGSSAELTAAPDVQHRYLGI